jgi:hypothetical protein
MMPKRPLNHRVQRERCIRREHDSHIALFNDMFSQNSLLFAVVAAAPTIPVDGDVVAGSSFGKSGVFRDAEGFSRTVRDYADDVRGFPLAARAKQCRSYGNHYGDNGDPHRHTIVHSLPQAAEGA